MSEPLHNLSAIVLAAGLSCRFGAGDKLMAEFDGRPLLTHVLDNLKSLGLSQLIVVTRHDLAALEALRQDPALTCVINTTPESGMGSSLALGITALEPCAGVFIVLADMPFIAPDLYRALSVDLAGHDIVVPVHAGQRGHPVLFAARCFDQLSLLKGDTGARALIDDPATTVKWHATDSRAIGIDIDTPEDLLRASAR